MTRQKPQWPSKTEPAGSHIPCTSPVRFWASFSSFLAFCQAVFAQSAWDLCSAQFGCIKKASAVKRTVVICMMPIISNNEVLHDFATIHCSFPCGTKNHYKEQKHLYRYLKYQDSTYQIYSKIYLGVILTLTVTGWLLSLIAAKTLKLPGPEKLQSCWDDEGKFLLPTKFWNKYIFEFEMTMITSHRRK